MASGFSRQNERVFLLKGHYDKGSKELKKELMKTMTEKEAENALAMRRYTRSNIDRKTEQALLDLKLIFEKTPRWKIGLLFPEEKLLQVAAESAYENNRAIEFQRRRELGHKREVNKNTIKEKTAKELQERINAILDDVVKQDNT